MEEAIIGIIGTLLGTILGWGLNLLSNSRGKLDISVVSCYCQFFDIKKNKTITFCESPDSVFINLSFRVTNFKNHMIGLNNYKIQIEYGEECVQVVDIFKNEEGKTGDNLEELANLPAYYTKSIYYMHTLFVIPESEKMKTGFKIIMTYHVNGKRKEYKKILHEQKKLE